MTTIAEYLAKQLSIAGIRTVYGLPGGENVEILEAIRMQGIDFVLVRNESSACFMAAASARLTGIPGLAITTLGPGATNAYAGFAHAYLDRAPVLMITAASDPSLAGRHSHQALELEAIFRPISKFTAEISADKAAETIQEALYSVTAGRPGPAHLSIHNDVALQAAGERPAPHVEGLSSSPAKYDLKRLAKFFAGKERPVIVVGLGLEPERPYGQLRRLAEKLGAPLIDSPKSKGALSADHPLFVGTLGLTASDPAYQILNEADSIIAVGFDVVELVKPWDQPQPLIWIANWANEDPRIACAIEIAGPIADALEALTRVDLRRHKNWGAKRVKAFRGEQAHAVMPSPQSRRVMPQAFLAALREETPDDVIITTDVGSHKIFAALYWQARSANSYLVSNGLSAMGYGLSSAIAAAKVGRRPVVCITGDAGLAMVMGELGLLAELELPVIVAVMNDSALDLIRSAQTRRRRRAFGTEFRNPDFGMIARGFGLDYRRAETQDECADAIKYGLSTGKPLLVDVMIDPVGYPTTPR
ncbi:MAG: thiamine pyrophosphate-binding protein [Chloroflexi bacterium]|nr:thiamine pyrophosphate-binding protein [Chloroflexota bacterium]